MDYISPLQFVFIGYFIQPNGEIMDIDNKLIAFVVIGLLVGVGVGYGVGVLMDSGDDAEYHFYMYFDANDDRNGWYSAKGANPAEGFDKAMKDANLEYELSGGYLSTVDETGSWSVNAYLYSDTGEEAMLASVTFPEDDQWGYFASSNGWLSFKGHGGYDDDQEFKIIQSTSTIFFFSVYAGSSAPTPIDVDDWMNEGPFKA